MEERRRRFTTLFYLAALTSLLLLAACSAEQVRMSPTLAVLDTSAFSPDGKVVAGGRNIFNAVFLYDASTVHFNKALIGDSASSSNVKAHTLSFSKDSKYLAAAGIDDIVVVWDLSSDQKIRLTNLKGARAASFSPESNVLAVAGQGNDVTFWKIPDSVKVGELTRHSAPIISMAFSPDGKMIATGSADKTARVWSVHDLQQVKVFDGYEYPVHAVSFSPDGTMLATYSGNLKVWRWGSGDEQKIVSVPVASGSSVQAFAGLVSILGSARSIQLGGWPTWLSFILSSTWSRAGYFTAVASNLLT